MSKKYEYILIKAKDLVYEIFRTRILSDDTSLDDMKTLIKSS